MFLKNEFSNRLVQVSLFAGIVYYITAYPVVFEKARKYFPIKFKKTHHLLIFHTFVFMVLMYLLTYFVFDPIVRVVEGAKGVKGADGDDGISVGEICNDNLKCMNGLECVNGQCKSQSSLDTVNSQGDPNTGSSSESNPPNSQGNPNN